MRIDLDVIYNLIAPDTRVLDLGCGDGSLLNKLKHTKNVEGMGIEIDPENFNTCLEKGLTVIEQDLDKGLGNFSDNSFDVVVMSQTLQAMHHPDVVLDETLRVGKQSIVAFPNFGHWQARLYLGTAGRMPVSKNLPHSWYETPNIHFCTIRDFEDLCREKNIRIIKKVCTGQVKILQGLSTVWPNLFASTAIYHLSR